MNARARIRQHARKVLDVPASPSAVMGLSAIVIMRSALNGGVAVAVSRPLPSRSARTRIRQQAWRSLRLSALPQLPPPAVPRQRRTSGRAVVGQLPQLAADTPHVLA
jgi:hypothetical protein